MTNTSPTLRFICLTALSIAALAVTEKTLADTVITSTPSAPPSNTTVIDNTAVIASTPPAPPSTNAEYPRHHHNGLHINLNVDEAPHTTVVTSYPAYHHGEYFHPRRPYWVAMHTGEPLPVDAVIGGSEFNPNAMFYVCRAQYRGGVHPGKYYGGNCNISWAGRVVMMQNYEVLVSARPLAWVESSHGIVPSHAIPGGSNHSNTFYICQADYKNGTHPGKLVGNNCHFSMGGAEFMTAYYNVLTG